jgi:MFS transporter, FSR family, fosmidomycin resistance protein
MRAMSIALGTADGPPSRAPSGARTIALVSLAHAVSHFFHLLLPPLFPAFRHDFGLSYSELGLAVTLFFVVSGLGQASAGFLVDKIGARPLLFGALGCFVAAALAAAGAQGLGGLMFAAALAGLGNAPFHPVDFTILNRRVDSKRLGHAYAMHGISGSLGWAAAPALLIGLSTVGGGWRWAYLGAAVLALAVLFLLYVLRDDIDDRIDSAIVRPGATAVVSTTPGHLHSFLRSPAVWLCFAFFVSSSVSLGAVQSFVSPALGALYGLPLAATAFVVTGYMIMNAIGTLIGGFVTNRVAREELTIAVAMACAASLLVLAASGWIPGTWAAWAVVAAGLGAGIVGPSRDLMIKHAAPAGATGRVYGLVYSGFDVGFAVGAPVYGWLLDHGQPIGVFAGAAIALCAGIVCAALVARHTRGTRATVPA